MAIIDKSKKQFIQDRDDKVFIGLDLPIRLSNVSGSGYFARTSTTIKAVKNNIKNLIQTEKGERLLQPGLGLDLKRFLFEQLTVDTKMAIENEITSTLQRWLPFVMVNDIKIDITETNSSYNRMVISLTFSILKDPKTLDSVTIEVGE